MKIIKPLRLGVLSRPFRWQGSDQLGISLLALTDMSAAPQLRPECELWQLAASELAAGGVLDMAVPKACAEYLISGYAFTAGRADNTVSIDIGGLSKTQHFAREEGQDAPPAGDFAPLDLQDARRFKRLGLQYDEHWLQQTYPGFACDTDWRLFNAAREDQWWPDDEALPAQADWCIRNMHPRLPVQQGRLPQWRARCFINRQQPPQLEEAVLRATTVWFFPHRQQMIVIWQGRMTIAQDDAADILQLMPALEIADAVRPLQHYQQVLLQRLDKQQGALCALREEDLLPSSLIGPWRDTEPGTTGNAVYATLQQRQHQLREQHRARLAQRGWDIEQLIPPPEMPPAQPLAEVIAQLEQQAAARLADAEQRLQSLARPQASGDATSGMQQMQALLQRHGEQFSVAQRAEITTSLHQLRLMITPEQEAPPDIARSQQLRQQVQAIMAGNRDFSDLDLSGADLSQLDLSGANFSRTLLTQTRLQHTRLCATRFEHTSLAAACCSDCDFSGAQFIACNWRQAQFTDCQFAGAHLCDMSWQDVRFDGVCFQQATLENLLLPELRLNRADFRAAALTKVVLLHCQLQHADFSHATLNGCALVTCQAQHTRFRQAALLGCAFTADSDCQRADFTQASLSQCNLRQLALEHACFRQARLENSDLSEARCQYADLSHSQLAGNLFIRSDLRHATLTDSNLIGTLLQKSLLDGANLAGANLFRADVSQSTLNPATQLGEAYTRRMKVWPQQSQVTS